MAETLIELLPQIGQAGKEEFEEIFSLVVKRKKDREPKKRLFSEN